MKLALACLLSFLFLGTVCTEGFIIYRNQKEIRELKQENKKIIEGASKVLSLAKNVFEKNSELATDVNACHLFLFSRGLWFIWQSKHPDEDLGINGKSET